MARYTGPKARVNRRLGTLVYENSGASRAFDRRPSPPGDVITVRRRNNLLRAYQGISESADGEPVDWITFDNETLRITVQGAPGPSDISLPVDGNIVVEFMSR